VATGIEWTDETWNPVVGCTHISPGCDNCYAATVASRQMQPAHVGLTVGRRWNDTVRLLPDRLDIPLRWSKPRRVFVCSMSDLFHQDVPADFIVDVWRAMEFAPQHTFQVLTKRPKRMAALLRSVFFEDLPNVWLGTSIESQRYAWRARHLANTPAAVRFLSVEPLIEPVVLNLDGIHWVIVGAESGPRRRPCFYAWVRSIRDQCAEAGVALFVKQLHDLDGRVVKNIEDFPADLRIREWPT
jgi:protein gp37